MPQPERALDEISRVLKIDGKLIAPTFTPLRPGSNAVIAFDSFNIFHIIVPLFLSLLRNDILQFQDQSLRYVKR